jgi:hypothetical protein
MVTPDLGELLVYLSIATSITWETIATPFLQEFYDRFEISLKFLIRRIMLWIFDGNSGNHGELSYVEKDHVSFYRMENTFAVFPRIIIYSNVLDRQNLVTFINVSSILLKTCWSSLK